ncbi:hypothetical protein D0Y50_11375 [Salinimonas sediminis]|uniref:Uncharacterized protein n=1 Tax=Salinimonas sediminis TaxID=2303538 RepID=A0A346NMZ6_9ALTE|nr:hypothetical protein D0Y50_11375 [Salinimonas sediminis]
MICRYPYFAILCYYWADLGKRQNEHLPLLIITANINQNLPNSAGIKGAYVIKNGLPIRYIKRGVILIKLPLIEVGINPADTKN